jgi:hypothetical protein
MIFFFFSEDCLPLFLLDPDCLLVALFLLLMVVC